MGEGCDETGDGAGRGDGVGGSTQGAAAPRVLASPLRPARYRVIALVWAVGLFGTLTVIALIDQAQKLMG